MLRGTPSTLIWVSGEASGVFGAGEIVSRPPDADALAGAASTAIASPATRYLLLGLMPPDTLELGPGRIGLDPRQEVLVLAEQIELAAVGADACRHLL
jgi:hypothetical protein